MGENNLSKQIEELTLLVLYLTSWEEKMEPLGEVRRSWKTHRFKVLDELGEKGLLSGSKGAKSVYFTERGEQLAEKLKDKYL